MGMDFLDFSFRIEKRFGLKIHREDSRMLDAAWTSRKPYDITAAELHEWVVKLLKARRLAVPHSSWNRVRLELAKVVGKPPQAINRDTLVVRDLGFG